jgi:hypothetical protein
MSDRPLHLYTDRSFLPDGARPSLLTLPFWGYSYTCNNFEAYQREAPELLRLTDRPEDAEFAVLPFDATPLLRFHGGPEPHFVGLARQFVERARAAGLRTLVTVMHCDSSDPIRLPDVIVFRNAIEGRRRSDHDFALPAWHDSTTNSDLSAQFKPRPWAQRPVVGFCGLAARSGPRLRRQVRLALQRLSRPLGLHLAHTDGLQVRKRAMDRCAADGRVETDFVIRDAFFGNALAEPDRLQKIRDDYVANLASSDYTLCARGYGNYSLRFYETLSIGRIPLQIDTECVLPFDFVHDYAARCAIVPEGRIDDVVELLLEFHSRHTDASYQDLQRSNRDFWKEWLSPEGFVRHIRLHWDRSGRHTA